MASDSESDTVTVTSHWHCQAGDFSGRGPGSSTGKFLSPVLADGSDLAGMSYNTGSLTRDLARDSEYRDVPVAWTQNRAAESRSNLSR